ncbi:hypothetical protein Y032_0501g2598 [Ancylostoma ceylanicum]|nr:hypothetical protein Y032_0501g2598 [Ancylostoma ceylanicum]
MHRRRGAAQQAGGGCRRQVFFGTTVYTHVFSCNAVDSISAAVWKKYVGDLSDFGILPGLEFAQFIRFWLISTGLIAAQTTTPFSYWVSTDIFQYILPSTCAYTAFLE